MDLSKIREIDLGTPARESEVMVTLEIDGEQVTVPEGTSVMRAASLAGTQIPKLCATDSLEPFGSCRLCLVEIEGRRGYPASCTTPVEPGMKVRTQTDKPQSLRKGVMELYISDHPLDCLTCPANGNCELQDMAGVTGLREVRYGFAGENHLDAKKDESNPYFTYDASKCIVCNRQYIVIYDADPGEPLEAAPVACPHCWQIGTVQVARSVSEGQDYRAEKV